MKSLALLVGATLTALSAQSTELLLDIDKFYAVPENEQMFKLMDDSGQLKSQRTMVYENCLKEEKAENKEAKCKCIDESMTKLTDRQLVHISMVSYTAFQATVSAMQNGNKEEADAIQQKMEAWENPMADAVKKCEAL